MNGALELAISQFFDAQHGLALVADVFDGELSDRTVDGVKDWISKTPATIAADVRRKELLEGEAQGLFFFGDDEDARQKLKDEIEKSKAQNGPMMKFHEQIWLGNGEHPETA